MAFIKDFECYSCGSSLGKWQPGREYTPGGAKCFVCNACQGEVWLLPDEVQGLDWFSICRLAGIEHGCVEDILPRLHTPGGALSTRKVKAGVWVKEGLEFVFDDIPDKAISELRDLFDEFREIESTKIEEEQA